MMEVRVVRVRLVNNYDSFPLEMVLKVIIETNEHGRAKVRACFLTEEEDD